jgi:LacI family transcriptional regulator
MARKKTGGHGPTIFDIARAAGVSYSTVSRIANNYEFVKPATRARVEAVMEELGYVANVKARSLAGGKSQVIGLLVYDLNSSYLVEIVRGIDDELSRLDYDLMLSTTHRRKHKEASVVSRLVQGVVDGLLIVLPRNLEAYVADLSQQQFPYVLIDYTGGNPASNAVRATNRVGGQAATEYLLGLGHRRIGCIIGPLSVGCAQERLDGYAAALRAHGLAYDPALVVGGDFLEASGHSALHELLKLDQPPTAIFSSSDSMAIGAMRAAVEAGLRVPEDLSIIGFDDIPEAAAHSPALTTIRQPLQEMGRIAVRLLIEHIENPDRMATHIELPTQLIERASCVPYRAG